MPEIEFGGGHVEAARGILVRCAGLPIAPAVTGEAVALRVNIGLRFETACQTYFARLSSKMHSGMEVLDAAISPGLDSLEQCGELDGALDTPYSLRKMYFSLCVLQNQQRALISILCRMWEAQHSFALEICVLFSSMSLCTITDKDEYGVQIHDLHLEFTRRMAENTSVEWYRRYGLAVVAEARATLKTL